MENRKGRLCVLLDGEDQGRSTTCAKRSCQEVQRRGDRGHVRWFPRRRAGAPRMGRHAAWRLGHWWARACYARGQTIHWLLGAPSEQAGERPQAAHGRGPAGWGAACAGEWAGGQRAQLAGPGRLARRAGPRAAQKGGGRWSSQGGRRWAWGAGSWTRAGPAAAIGEGLVCFYFLFLFFCSFYLDIVAYLYTYECSCSF